MSFTTGNNNCAIMNASNAASKQMMTDSSKNCFINELLYAPDTFLIPISFARSEDLAVTRLM